MKVRAAKKQFRRMRSRIEAEGPGAFRTAAVRFRQCTVYMYTAQQRKTLYKSFRHAVQSQRTGGKAGGIDVGELCKPTNNPALAEMCRPYVRPSVVNTLAKQFS
jgi:hypothetical protein